MEFQTGNIALRQAANRLTGFVLSEFVQLVNNAIHHLDPIRRTFTFPEFRKRENEQLHD
jgi:hypothetical protein